MEDDGIRITITTSSLVIVGTSLGHGTGGLADANGYLNDRPTQGFFTIAFFGLCMPHLVATLFWVAPFNTSSDTFILEKEAK